MTLPVPDHIGRFRVVGLLGQGAMGVVYRARDDALERDVALKVMAAAALGDADNRQRFLREARASARLQHPNIVTIYELGEHAGQPFMALELLEGLDLQRAIELGIRPDPKLILPIVLQVLAGLGHAHAHGVVHRDVKPSNIFIPHGRPVKIMDFGVARLAATTLTTAGTVLGTPSYMSPEQVRGGEVDGRSDLFSAGLILYELLTGERAFRAGSVVAVLYKIAHEAPDLSLLPASTAWAPLRAVLERVLERDPAARYADAAAMSQELLGALLMLGGTPDWPSPPDLSLLTLGTPRPRVVPAATWRAEPTEPAPPAALADLPLTHTPEAPPLTTAAPPGALERTVRDEMPVRARTAGRRPVALASAVVVAGLLVALALLRGRERPGAPLQPVATVSAPATPGVPPGASRPATSTPPPPDATPAPARPAPTAVPALPTPAPTTAADRPAPPPGPGPAPATAGGSGVTSGDARLERAERLLEQGRYASALGEARAVLAGAPDNEQARDIVQEAEALMLVESSLSNAREAWRRGDRDTAQAELRKGLAVRPNEARLLALWREITR